MKPKQLITAEEARRRAGYKTEEVVRCQLESISQRILSASENGSYDIYVDKLHPQVKAYLETKGYSVVYVFCQKGSFHCISWRPYGESES